MDPTYREVRDRDDLPSVELDRIAQFFQVYKALRKKKVEVGGWADAEAARKMVRQALAAYDAQ